LRTDEVSSDIREAVQAAGPGLAPRASRAGKIAALVAAAGLVVVAHQLGILHAFADPGLATRAVGELGVWGYVAFVLVFALLQPFGLPGTVLIVAAPMIWPWPLAFALSMTGTMAASVIGFSFARFVARDWVTPRIPRRFQRFAAALESRGFTTVFLLRLVFWMPPPLHAFLGVSGVRFSTHFWGSLAGYVAPLLVVSYVGPQIFDALRGAPVELWIGLASALALAGLALWAYTVLRRRRIALLKAGIAEAAPIEG
jgi:uncharacterized membrane protein YdjX (TVP38/TMEM64 family)